MAASSTEQEKRQSDEKPAAVAIAETLRAYDVSHIFGMKDPIALFRAARKAGIQAVTVRNEKHAAIMAHGFAKATNRPGVCASICGPGATNLTTGLLEALHCSVPVIAFVLDIPAAQRGRHAASELDHFSTLRPVSKWVSRIDVPERAAELTRHAFRVATTGRPGPVVVLCPRDIMDQMSSEDIYVERGCDRFPAGRVRPDIANVRDACDLLVAASQPVIVAGGGAILSQAYGEVVELAEALSAPVATTMNGRGAIADSHRLSVGVLGTSTGGYLGRGRIANEILAQADVALVVGSRMGQICTHDWTLPRAGTKLVHVDVDPMEIGRNFRTHVHVVGDAKLSLAEFLDACRDKGWRQPNEAQLGLINDLRARWQEEITPFFESNSTPIRPERVLYEISSKVAGDSLIVTDASYVTGWAMSHIDTHGGGNPMISPRGTGGLGWGLPAAVGAKLGQRQREVICVTGDGGFGYVLTEMETAARYGIKVIVVVFNNQTLAFQKHVEEQVIGESWDCDYLDVNYANVAKEMHWHAERVTDPGELGSALERSFKADGPYLLDVLIDPRAIAPIVALTTEGDPIQGH